jgi:predicted aldo/keto reductase-like oxidoreductase
MSVNPKSGKTKYSFSRRSFLKTGSAVIAGSALPLASGCASNKPMLAQTPNESKIREYRTLGRTGFKTCDVSFGGVPQTANVIRYCYDKGINYFDTAESYGNGESENRIGEAMQHMDRKKIFITTKINLQAETTHEQLVDRFNSCLGRMKTEYADALYIHNVDSVAMVAHDGFHGAVDQLKAEGKLKHAGVSYHGPQGEQGEPMDQVLVAAANDGRYDLMLLVYNHMAREEGEKILAACKQKNLGATLMKTSPGGVVVEPLALDNLNEDYQDWYDVMIERGMAHDDVVARMQRYNEQQIEEAKQVKPFVEKHSLTTELQLRQLAMQWALANKHVHTVCISMPDFDSVDNFVSRSGMQLTQADTQLLRDYRYAYSQHYCRHGCTSCLAACPQNVPVSTIMRYSTYFTMQGREKLAMSKYAKLRNQGGSACLSCSAPCTGACPHGVNIQAKLIGAHGQLTLA